MRSLLVVRDFPPEARAGVATLSQWLWAAMSEEGPARLVAGYRGDPTVLPPCRRVALGRRGPALDPVSLALAARWEVLRRRPDVVVTQGVDAVPPGVPVVGLLGDPHRGSAVWGALQPLRRAGMIRRVGRLAIGVVPTAATRQRLAEYGAPIDRVEVAWPGVDVEAFRPEGPALPADGPVRLLYAARIEPGKGQHVAIEAVKGLGDAARGRVHLDLVGPVADPVYAAQLRRRAHGAPVSFHVDVADLASWYRQSHIVLFPTVSEEVFGHSAVDGMACGKPVVYSRFRAIDEATAGIGVAVPPGDVGRLGLAIRSLLQAPERCRELGEAGRALVLERYPLDKAVRRYLELVRRVAR